MKRTIDNEWLQIAMFGIWLTTVYLGPMFFCDTGIWLACGIGGGMMGLIALEWFEKDTSASLSKHHFYALLGYCFAAIMLIGFFKDISYECMKDLGKCAIFYFAVSAIIWLAESIYDSHKESKERKEEWEYLKSATRIEIGRLFVKVKWEDHERKPQLRHLIKPIIESEDVWEIISIDNEDVTLQSCIEDRIYINEDNEWWRTPTTKTIGKNTLRWYYADVSDIFNTNHRGENELMDSYKQTIEQLKKKEAIIRQWVENKKGKD